MPAQRGAQPFFRLAKQLSEYQIDLWQRGVVFLDTLRERGNNLFDQDKAGMPVLLDFEDELILDPRRFDPASIAHCCA